VPDPGTADRNTQGKTGFGHRALDTIGYRPLVGDIDLDVQAADIGGHQRSPLFVEVGDGNDCARFRERTGCGFAKAGGSSGDEGRCAAQIHNAFTWR
jgi:hypothetical protein